MDNCGSDAPEQIYDVAGCAMVDLNEIIRTSALSAKDQEIIRATLEALKELREAGVLKSAETISYPKRPTLIGVKPKAAASRRLYSALSDT